MITASSAGHETAVSQTPGDSPVYIVIQPNSSLSPGLAIVFFATMLLIQLVIAIGVLLATGSGWVLPFAGMELAALGAALLWCMRENQYREVIVIGNGSVKVERGYRAPQQTWQAAAAWSKVVLEPATSSLGKPRLMLSSAGKNCEIGRCLTEVEKLALADRLKGLIRQCAG